jgi:CubicO group peptidase (beta-lactamase class C family)
MTLPEADRPSRSARKASYVAQAIQQAIDLRQLAGAIALTWRKGKITSCEVRGQRNMESALPMTRDAIFRVAAMTQPITSVLILSLVERGKLDLAAPISRWAPELAPMLLMTDPQGSVVQTRRSPRAITIEDLLTHRSGLTYAFTASGPIARLYEQQIGDINSITRTPDSFMRALGHLPLVFPPGQRFQFSHATDVLGVIAERAEQMPFRDLLRLRVLEPLGMSDTDFAVPPAKRHRLAVPYSSDTLAPLPVSVPEEPPAFCAGGNGLYSTIDDYLQFALMMLGRGANGAVRILKPETVDLMLSDRLTPAQHEIPFMGVPFWEGVGFGLGIASIQDVSRQAWAGPGSVGAFGWPSAWGTWWRVDPSENMALLYFSQCVATPGAANGARILTGQGTPVVALLKAAYSRRMLSCD